MLFENCTYFPDQKLEPYPNDTKRKEETRQLTTKITTNLSDYDLKILDPLSSTDLQEELKTAAELLLNEEEEHFSTYNIVYIFSIFTQSSAINQQYACDLLEYYHCDYLPFLTTNALVLL